MSRGWPSALVLSLCLMLLGFGLGPAGAAEPEGGGAGGQTNIFEFAGELGIWTIVVFVVLLLVLKKLAWRPMLEGLHKREENIRAAIEEARKAREEAQHMREQFQEQMNKAQEQVRDILEAGRRDAERVGAEVMAKARAEAQAERERSRREIEMARDQALQELWNQAADVATAVSTKAIRRQLTPDDHRRLVDEALAELRTSGAPLGNSR